MASNAAMPPQGSDWPTLSRLAAMDETQRRRLLRSHKETTVDATDVEQVDQLRKQLDQELEQLSGIELRAECGDALSAQKIQAIQPFADLTRNSPSFAQYLNSYLYFGVRFAAGRLGNPSTTIVGGNGDEINDRPIGLPSPPPCERVPAGDVKKAAEMFLAFEPGSNVEDALNFLDDCLEQPGKVAKFELWLRGLYSNQNDEPGFKRIAQGLYDWAVSRSNFYIQLQERTGSSTEERAGNAARILRWRQGTWFEGQWRLTNPAAARCGLADFYWMAKVLRAEVSARAVVRYQERSWLSYLPFLKVAGLSYGKDEILRIEEVLRSAFDFACELIQNGVEMAETCERESAYPSEYPRRPWTVDWRAAFDEELTDIAQQRKERTLDEHAADTRAVPVAVNGRTDNYWCNRIRSGESEQHLVGIALSGGGIRSATFNLGVLQGLKELDRLRQVDYLSTVSGGGYIGAWLVGNVRRTRYWLSSMTSWEESIDYLRRYSKYLAPHSGFLNADTWVIWGTWIRNAFLIQLTAVAWLAAAFALVLAMKSFFELSGNNWFHIPLGIIFVLLAAIIGRSIKKPRFRSGEHHLAVALAWLGSFVTAALLWQGANQQAVWHAENLATHSQGAYRALLWRGANQILLWRDAAHPHYDITQYSKILAGALLGWPWWVTGALFLCLCALAYVSFWPKQKLVASIFTALLSIAVAYLGLCGILYVFGHWASDRTHFGWYAYVFGPTLVLAAITLAITVFIGLIAGTSADWKREWWTRYGSWLAIYGTALMALSLAAVFGPVWVHKLFKLPWNTVKWGAVAGWIGSTVAGLMAGNSNKTKGNGQVSSKAPELVAKLGALLFIAGAVIAVSSLLRFALVHIWLDNAGDDWSSYLNLNSLLSQPVAGFSPAALELTLAILLACAAIFSWRFNLNTFGMNQFYRNRLVRCYLGATRWKPGMRRPQGFTGFDDNDEIPLEHLQYNSLVDGMHFRGPFPILNCSLNLGGSSDLSVKTRQSACFTLTPLHAGSDRPHVGYAPVRAANGFAGSPRLGQAVSISGAAASPNMGYNTTPLVAVLLTMFNVRLAWWFPNPGHKKWGKDSPIFSLSYLIWEFLGLADETSNFVNVSDGGHFENLGIYELVRRRAKVIIACDAECDPDLAFGSLGNVIRICETDFGAKIEIDTSSIKKQAETGLSHAHCAVGQITYSNGSQGYLIYLKSSISGDEDVAVQQYLASHPDFPHQTTADQFFTEDQFESYRRLGHHIATVAFRDVADKPNMVAVASKLHDLWAPVDISSSAFVTHSNTLDRLWERLRTSPSLKSLLLELVADGLVSEEAKPPDQEELCACLEMLQLMEDVFLDLRLNDFWNHPDNRGWVVLFTMWAKSPKFRAAWTQTRRTFGIRFGYFCEQRLGLEAEDLPTRLLSEHRAILGHMKK